MGVPALLLSSGYCGLLLLLQRASATQVEFGTPKLVGSSNFTHFWFPVNVMELGSGAAAVILQGIQQAGDGAICPPKTHPTWPCSTLRTSFDRGSSWRPENGTTDFPVAAGGGAGKNGPFPLLPQAPLDGRRARNPSNFTSIHAFKCANASCAGELVQWSARPGGLKAAKTLRPLTVRGVPANLRLAANPGNPLMLHDGSILVALYGYTTNAHPYCTKSKGWTSCGSLFFLSCPDPVNSPTEWQYTSTIDAAPAMFEHVPVDGPCEPAVVQLQDGRIFTVFRVESFRYHWGALSTDGAKTWGDPFETGTWAVAPNLLELTSGIVVLTSGRPAIGLWLASSRGFTGKADDWEFHNVIKAHNGKVADPALRYPEVDAAVVNVSSRRYVGKNSWPYKHAGHDATTAYTGLGQLNDTTLLLSYDRLANGWDGPPGPMGEVDAVFSMTVKITAHEAMSP